MHVVTGIKATCAAERVSFDIAKTALVVHRSRARSAPNVAAWDSDDDAAKDDSDSD